DTLLDRSILEGRRQDGGLDPRSRGQPETGSLADHKAIGLSAGRGDTQMRRQTLARILVVLAAPLALSACIKVSLEGLGKGEDRPTPTTYTLLESNPGVMDVAAEAA